MRSLAARLDAFRRGGASVRRDRFQASTGHREAGAHVLEGCLRFIFPDGEIDAPAGTTVFVPAGVAHTYRVVEPSRYLIILTPKIEALIARLLRLPDLADLVSALDEFDTVMAVDRA